MTSPPVDNCKLKTNKKTDKKQLFHKKHLTKTCKKIEQEETEPCITFFSQDFPNAKTKTNQLSFKKKTENDQPLLNGYLCGRAKINEICKRIQQDLNPNEIEILAKLLPTFNKSFDQSQTIK
ncbi:hypothetical protein M0813_23966 [Anaeramoeba flamelloides]|uniref:Uncharacterized protein n=1 Tax=Anaeramoeba flamelloides TaxID=1746091 RepID=A0AAV7ZAN6_9EUKA|nr:hypothetical protein M0812_17334 [Anaeramoeba flamelloides]KAJ6240867.1 hypothetical protein M0813_23966 [Anaeramoeba flamelloides]